MPTLFQIGSELYAIEGTDLVKAAKSKKPKSSEVVQCKPPWKGTKPPGCTRGKKGENSASKPSEAKAEKRKKESGSKHKQWVESNKGKSFESPTHTYTIKEWLPPFGGSKYGEVLVEVDGGRTTQFGDSQFKNLVDSGHMKLVEPAKKGEESFQLKLPDEIKKMSPEARRKYIQDFRKYMGSDQFKQEQEKTRKEYQEFSRKKRKK